jgi:ATP-dependent Clp protease protease subunit
MKLPAIPLPPRPKGLRFDVRAVAEPSFTVKAEAGLISIFDVIGLEVTASRVAGALRAIGAKAVTVQINSLGGDPFEGAAIYNLLRDHTQPVTVQVLGMAASAASLVAMAGQRVEIARNAQIMIHRASAIAMGNADELKRMIQVLENTDAAMAGVYQARTALPIAQITSMMEAETYMLSGEAIDLGFADALLERDAAEPPRLAALGAPGSKPALEQQLRSIGMSRAVAARAAAAAWPAIANDDDPNGLDFDAIAARVSLPPKCSPKREC